MIRTLQGHQPAFRFASSAMPGQPCQFDGAFNGLGAAVREKGALQSGEAAEFLGKQPLVFVVVEIRQVNGSGCLFADGLYDSRVCVAQGVYTEAGDEIQVTFAAKIEQKNAFASGHDERITVVGLE